MTAMLELAGTSKSYGSVKALRPTELTIDSGEFFALLGPSGCGKTTLLRLIAGFEFSDEGTILIDGQDVTKKAPYERPVNIVFQSYAVFPHMTVEQNVGYGLKIAGTSASEMNQRVTQALEQVQLGALRARMPHQLSGGQRQRVALARALIMQPKMLLLDEPLSALDRKLRKDMQLELMRLQQEVGITFIIVTHDQEEALSMASRIAVMKDGIIHQIADPETLYEKPVNSFVADFLGSANLVPVTCGDLQHGQASVAFGDFSFTMPCDLPEKPAQLHLMIRPEKLELTNSPDGHDSSVLSLPVVYRNQLYLGEQRKLYVESAGDVRWEVAALPDSDVDLQAESLHLRIPLSKAQLLPEG